MAMLGKRRPRRERSGVSGLQGRQPHSPPYSNARGDASSREGEAQGLMIERLAHDGRGVTHDAEGKTLFVDGALPGERVEVAVHLTRKRFDEAHVREVLEASPERVKPPCDYYQRCGGCDLQHLSVPAQRRHKQAVLVDLLARQGVEIAGEPELLAGASQGYRRRARLGVKLDAEGRLYLGFRARHSHRLVDIAHCTILMPELDALLAPLHRQLMVLQAPRQVGHLELLASDQGSTLVIRQLKEHAVDREAWRVFAREHGIHLGWLAGRDAPALEWLTPPPRLSYRVPGAQEDLELGIAPGDFLQANEEVNRQMVETALGWLDDLAGTVLLDLFAGVGNFSLPLASAGARVVAVEGSPSMVERLGANARANASANGGGLQLSARQANLASLGTVAALLEEIGPEVVVLDPPREGAEGAARALAAAPVPRVLYIACDPATLARDAAHLAQGGYRVTRIAVADMFVHTSHLESMLLFEHSGMEERR
ncbi:MULTISPECIES: TRAM domain-containing protein [unclassified Halomonas]|uniref:TRAM domain-containing protein n=1 Tax=unclassified Halomonas TaxID=2609666 RepID=UPI002886BDE9|nr:MULTISPECIES: TRAM domain-containing protein [unclassified Halomonas]MDT0501142.1 TRAM domain-containing protein [Halomonas sp. PAR7]MDT0511479.1 TRAM domain-containing protein [Halomonas sp. LES1]MDT0590233.1 TRAM domain-containing protein [Halomonas sp. PAR8]